MRRALQAASQLARISLPIGKKALRRKKRLLQNLRRTFLGEMAEV
jgi:hypothetical protein